MSELRHTVTVRHWIPILTFCPVNGLPDLIYVSVEYVQALPSLDYKAEIHELYDIRKRMRAAVSRKKMFMEEVAEVIAHEFKDATAVEVRLAFNRHAIRIEVDR